jgi:hypothetical protein
MVMVRCSTGADPFGICCDTIIRRAVGGAYRTAVVVCGAVVVVCRAVVVRVGHVVRVERVIRVVRA